MTTRRKIILIGVGVISILLIGFLFRSRPVTPEQLVEDKDKRAAILSLLIAKNGIVRFPPEFIIEDSSRITCSLMRNEDGEILTAAVVRYEVRRRGYGDRRYVFIFDPSGRCIFHSPDDTGALYDFSPYYMYFCDLTGDGNIEKLVAFDLYEVGKMTDSGQRRRSAFQVWRLSGASPTLLLEVHYDWSSDGKFMEPQVLWPTSPDDPRCIYVGTGIPDIVLGEGIFDKPLVVFRWSPQDLTYTCKTAPSENWEVVFPKMQELNGRLNKLEGDAENKTGM